MSVVNRLPDVAILAPDELNGPSCLASRPSVQRPGGSSSRCPVHRLRDDDYSPETLLEEPVPARRTILSINDHLGPAIAV